MFEGLGHEVKDRRGGAAAAAGVLRSHQTKFLNASLAVANA